MCRVAFAVLERRLRAKGDTEERAEFGFLTSIQKPLNALRVTDAILYGNKVTQTVSFCAEFFSGWAVTVWSEGTQFLDTIKVLMEGFEKHRARVPLHDGGNNDGQTHTRRFVSR